MKLLVDIGNTTTEFGLLNDGNLSYLGRIFNQLIEFNSIEIMLKSKKVTSIYISSVAPMISKKVSQILYEIYHIEPQYITSEIDSGVDIEIDNKSELGADLLCDIVGAVNHYGSKVAVIDFGTATKILFIDENKVFKSCAIFLGLEKSKRMLANSTELLPMVEDFEPKPISDCHNTIDVINTSSYYSQLFTVNGIIEKYEQEVGYKLKRVYTGGNAFPFMKEIGEENFDPYLCLKGLAILSERK